MRRARLTFSPGELERRTLTKTLEVMARELGARHGGRAMVTFPAPASTSGEFRWPNLAYGKHHMGTTRMSDDPSTGVVDRHGQVHGLTNLYIAGSSVFPSVGMANPTYTIIALTLRLAERLRLRLNSSV
jgi:choline dehydrogenase-like flavoprotein